MSPNTRPLPVALYPIGSQVWHRCNNERAGIVTGHLHRPGSLLYLVSWGEDRAEGQHHGVELTDERPLDLTNNGTTLTED